VGISRGFEGHEGVERGMNRKFQLNQSLPRYSDWGLLVEGARERVDLERMELTCVGFDGGEGEVGRERRKKRRKWKLRGGLDLGSRKGYESERGLSPSINS